MATALQMDADYEFCAPQFFDFMNEETEEDIHRVELWFETTLSYPPSPFMMKIKPERHIQLDSVCCDFGDVEPESTNMVIPEVNQIPCGKPCEDGRTSAYVASELPRDQASTDMAPAVPSSTLTVAQGKENCTPKAPSVLGKGAAPPSAKNRTEMSLIKKPSALKPKNQLSAFQSTTKTKPKSVARCPGSVAAKDKTSNDIFQENQAIKRQKLDGGGSRQIHTVKNVVLLHKSKLHLTSRKDHQEERTDSLMRKETVPFMSTAEMVKKFQSNTRDLSLNWCPSQESTASMIRSRPRLTLTRPKEPELQTAHRVRAVRVKSTAELEEEMLAKMPKFKARPVNKKILEAPSLPTLPRSAPNPPEFEEFHLKTMERASKHDEMSASVLSSSIDSSSQNHAKSLKLTAPRPPLLETSLRARPPNVKSTQELELEELEKIPKFKAKPLNKKILESRGDLGLFCNSKRQVTNPQEFHFATSERLGPPMSMVFDQFDKLSLHSESNSEHFVPRLTIPNPFHLYTEERGQEKERQFALQLSQKECEEERARIPRATPYPYTTDYPVMPPKPEPKECTKLEAFQLESLRRHEEEMQRKMEEKERMEKEEAQRRLFKAQPILRDDPIPLPEKERKPLTEVQEFVLHVDHRASDRAEFDKKMKEKEMTYKRIREEYELSKMVEEEKAVKFMRKTMVPHARPLPKFENPFLPQKSIKEATKPKSPKLNVIRREEERRRHLLCGGSIHHRSGSGYPYMR